MPRCWLCVTLLISPLVWGTAPSQEFWEYMADYSDENGEVLDPLAFDDVIAARDQNGVDPVDRTRERANKPSPENTAEQQEPVKKASATNQDKSSATTASQKGTVL
jgi:hypothetical protein